MSLILDTLPTPEEFFRIFWNKRPFVVRGMIPEKVTEALIDEDHLAGLSMEEDVKSRLVRKGGKQEDWRCDYGPFEKTDFAELGEKDWSLLVQNIDQYHDDTAELLKSFSFCPRWLLDDIMVSFSPKGGTVGAHTDSYHVFLVQGKGERRWKIAHQTIQNEDCIEDIPLEILKNPFDGEEVTVREGDVIYIPPKFAHQGVSLKPSLTYSVGFLGPSLSEMLIEFGHYLEEHNNEIPRYLGQNLTESAAPFQVASDHIVDFKVFMTDIFGQDYFAKWLTHYFCGPLQTEEDQDEASYDALDLIAQDAQLIKPPAVKIMFTPLKDPQKYSVSIGHFSLELDFSDLFLVNLMAQEKPFSASVFRGHAGILQELLDWHILLTTDE